MATGNAINIEPVASHVEVESVPVVGISGIVVTPADKKRYALQMLKSVTADDLMSAKDFALEEAEPSTLPDLDETLNATDPGNSNDNTVHEVIGSVQNAEIVGTPPVKITDTVIDAAANKALEHYTTASLKRTITTGRKQMDAVAKQYFSLYDELKSLRDMYLRFAQQHRILVQELNIRETLKIEGKLPRPLSDEQVDLLRGMKVKVLRSRRVRVDAPIVKQEKTDEEKQDQEFRETSFDLLKETQYESRNKLDLRKYDVAILHTKRVRCELCGKNFSTNEGLQSHLNSHSGHFYQCEWCPEKRFTAQKAFKKHLRFHADGDIKLKCPDCPKEFENKQQLDSHTKVHAPPSLKCRVHPGCKVLFKHGKERKRHELAPDNKLFLCKVCCKGYTSKAGVDRHMASHAKTSTVTSTSSTPPAKKAKR